MTGTNAQPLVTSGIYRYSRNPRHLGYIVTLAGLAPTRRSAPALCSVAVLAAAYAAWVPMEEDHLNRTLGDPDIAYQQQAHRWWEAAVRSRSGRALRGLAATHITAGPWQQCLRV